MQLTIRIPSPAQLPLIEAALREIGGVVVPKREKKVKEEKVFEPLVYRKTLADGTVEEHEMDGVTVDMAIRKIMSEVNRRANSDGRSASDFGHLPSDSVNEYIASWCERRHHVPARYSTQEAQ